MSNDEPNTNIDYSYSTHMLCTYPQTDRQDFEAQVARLNAQVLPVRLELASVTEERDALRSQLRDFAVRAK